MWIRGKRAPPSEALSEMPSSRCLALNPKFDQAVQAAYARGSLGDSTVHRLLPWGIRDAMAMQPWLLENAMLPGALKRLHIDAPARSTVPTLDWLPGRIHSDAIWAAVLPVPLVAPVVALGCDQRMAISSSMSFGFFHDDTLCCHHAFFDDGALCCPIVLADIGLLTLISFSHALASASLAVSTIQRSATRPVLQHQADS